MILDFYPKAFWDTFPQDILKAYPRDLVKSEAFRFHFKQKLGKEFIRKDGKKFILDCPFDTFEDLIIGLEFQSSRLDYYRKTVFYEYQANLHMNNKKDVRIVVFSTVNNKHKLLRHRVGPNEEFTMLIVSLKALNQKQTLNNSLYKINNKLDMSDKEKALFFSSPLMDQDNIVEAIYQISEDFYKINNCTENERIEMENIILLYLGKWCSQKSNGYEEGDDMVVLTPEAKKLRELIDNGIEKEKEKWFRSAIDAVDMVNRGSSLDDASKATGLSVSQISQLCGIN